VLPPNRLGTNRTQREATQNRQPLISGSGVRNPDGAPNNSHQPVTLQVAGATMRRAASTAAARDAALIAGSAVTASGCGDCAQAKATPNKRTSRSIGRQDAST